MATVFSHIIQKRFSQVNEDVATDALAFILNSSESARNGMIKLLRGLDPNMPNLQFRVQQTEGSIRPDMWGYDNEEPHVYIENKFWAGLTDNQPVYYLNELAKYTKPTVLLVVVPGAREQTICRELKKRIADANISGTGQDIDAGGIVYSFTTDNGPILAVTSWTRLLSILELEVADDPSARSDLLQLQSLCELADSDAFLPLSSEEVTDQRSPATIIQLGTVVQTAVDVAVNKGIVNIEGLMPQANWERVGRYAKFSNKNGVGFWIGIHFRFWKKYGGTPLWVVFSSSAFGLAPKVRSLLESQASRQGIFTVFDNDEDEFAIAIDILPGEEKDLVVRGIIDRLQMIANVLSKLK
jgi:hypothetical protein